MPFRHAPSEPPLPSTLSEWADDTLARHGPAAAIPVFRRAVALDPARAETLYIMGQALRDLAWEEGGGAWRRRAFQTDPAALAAANHRLGMAFAQAGRPGRALVCQLQALEQNPGHEAAADALQRLATDILAARDEGGKGNCLDAGLWTRIGHAAFRLSAFPVARGAFRRAAAAQLDDPTLYRYLGDTDAAMEDGDGAAVAFTRAARLNPEEPSHRRRLADTLLLLGRAAESVRHLIPALALTPDDGTLWSNLGHAWFRQRDYTRAAAAFTLTARLIPEEPAYRRCLADTLFLLDRTTESVRHLTRALALAPDDGGLWTTLGHAWFRRRDYARAAAAFTRALHLTPGDPDLERFRDIAAYRRLNARVMAGGVQDDSGIHHA